MLRVLRIVSRRAVSVRYHETEVKDTVMSAVLNHLPGSDIRQRQVFNCDVLSAHSDFDVRLGGSKWSATWFNNHEVFDKTWYEVFSLDQTDSNSAKAFSLDGSEMSHEDKHSMLDSDPTFYACVGEVKSRDGIHQMCGKYCCKDRSPGIA